MKQHWLFEKPVSWMWRATITFKESLQMENGQEVLGQVCTRQTTLRLQHAEDSNDGFEQLQLLPFAVQPAMQK